MTKLPVFMPLQGIASANGWLGARFFEGLQNYMENKNVRNENRIILGDFNCTIDKMERDCRNKTLYR